MICNECSTLVLHRSVLHSLARNRLYTVQLLHLLVLDIQKDVFARGQKVLVLISDNWNAAVTFRNQALSPVTSGRKVNWHSCRVLLRNFFNQQRAHGPRSFRTSGTRGKHCGNPFVFQEKNSLGFGPDIRGNVERLVHAWLVQNFRWLTFGIECGDFSKVIVRVIGKTRSLVLLGTCHLWRIPIMIMMTWSEWVDWRATWGQRAVASNNVKATQRVHIT